MESEAAEEMLAKTVRAEIEVRTGKATMMGLRL